MRLLLSVNGTARNTASLQGQGFLSAHLNMHDRPKDGDDSITVRIQGSHTKETETIRMEWPTVHLQVGDIVTLQILPEGDGDAPSEIRTSSESSSNLFSSGELAKETCEVSLEFDRRLIELLRKSEEVESEEEHGKFRRAVGAVLYELGHQLLYPVYRRHKELIPEDLKGELL